MSLIWTQVAGTSSPSEPIQVVTLIGFAITFTKLLSKMSLTTSTLHTRPPIKSSRTWKTPLNASQHKIENTSPHHKSQLR